MNHDLIAKHQEQILAGVFDGKDVSDSTTTVGGILPYARTYSSEELNRYIGELGPKLWAFASAIDLTHPDLRSFKDGLFVGRDSIFSEELTNMIEIMQFGFKNNMSNKLLGEIKSWVNKSHLDIYATLCRCLDDPAKNQLHVRFVSTREERDKIRRNKKTQVVGLGTLYSKGQTFWQEHASDFERFHRYNLYQKDNSDAQTRMKYMRDSGLVAIAGEVEKFTNDLKDKSVKEMYQGFCKITLVSAAVILAKIMGYEYVEDVKKLGYGWSSCSTERMTFVRPSKFEYKFFDDPEKEEGSLWRDRLEYYPRLYPLHELEGAIPENCQKVVDYLEACPDMGGKAMFDHYKVLVPTVNYPNVNQDEPHFKQPDGTSVIFDDVYTGQRNLDITLLKQKEIVGVLLGERDGDHYFLSYWI